MQKINTVFVCQNCGYQLPKWQGRCSECNLWNTIAEEIVTKEQSDLKISMQVSPQVLNEIQSLEQIRFPTQIGELDRVLGGGIVLGSVILIGGEPGIGKSTLMMQVCNNLSCNKTIIYISGEESLIQTKLRADRLGIKSQNFYILNHGNIGLIINQIEKLSPNIIVVDSIQTTYNPELSSSPGTITQLKESCSRLTQIVKDRNMSLFLIGHITKEGSIAGPKLLEHMVDVVLYFEGESHGNYRIIRGIKNRFGSTNESGFFEMTEQGLVEVSDPSKLFLSQRPKGVSGSAVIPIIEGTRPILVELQALVTNSGYGLPARRCVGIDYNRVSLLIAVLGKRAGFKLNTKDVYVNVTGGFRVYETATDLGVVIAIASSIKNKPLDPELIVLGEVGLAGEVRGVPQFKRRIHEVKKLGFNTVVISSNSIQQVENIEDIEFVGVGNIKEAIEKILG